MQAQLTFPARNKVQPEINVTPLVDVVLVLLIIFMVIGPTLEAGERVELPAVSNVDQKGKIETMQVTVTASGRLMLEKEYVEESKLESVLLAAHEAAPEKRVVIKGDRAAKYKMMRNIFSTVSKMGFPGVALSVNAKRGSGQGEE